MNYFICFLVFLVILGVSPRLRAFLFFALVFTCISLYVYTGKDANLYCAIFCSIAFMISLVYLSLKLIVKHDTGPRNQASITTVQKSGVSSQFGKFQRRKS